MLTAGARIGVTALVVLAVAVAGTAQPKLLVIFTVMISPFTKPVLEYVFVVDAKVPLTDEVHTYVGVPPLPTLAVKSTFVP